MVTAPDIPGHKVGGVLGSGGYATVYRAWQVAVGREVAVKAIGINLGAGHCAIDRTMALMIIGAIAQNGW